jgi:hypothetical protein
MLRDAGDLVDFVSIHTYPGTAQATDREAFDAVAAIVAREVGQAKAWIREYQPAREDQIEIVYSEWNLGSVPATGAFCSDMFSAIWASTFLGEMARNGVDAATHWDCFTHGSSNGGFALFHTLDNEGRDSSFLRKSQYYAFQLWNNLMGPQLLAAEGTGDHTVRSYASRSEDAITVMLLNTDRDIEVPLTVRVTDAEIAPVAELSMLTSREYFWNNQTRRPQWSSGLRKEVVAAGPDTSLRLPPFSIVYLRLPLSGSRFHRELASRPRTTPQPTTAKPELRFLIEEEVYAGDKIPGTLLAIDPGTGDAYPQPLPAAALAASGDAILDRNEVRLAEAVGHFTVQPQNPGPLTLIATVAPDTTVETTLRVIPSIPRPMVFWDFVDPPLSDSKQFRSDWELSEDAGMRANKVVARIDLPADGVIPTPKGNQRALLVVQRFPGPDRLKRGNIRGVFFDIKTGPGFNCADPDVGVTVVLQNPAVGYWMVLGTVPLPATGEWERLQIDATNPKHIQVMDKSYNLWLVLSAKLPVKGAVYLDRIGLMVR